MELLKRHDMMASESLALRRRAACVTRLATLSVGLLLFVTPIQSKATTLPTDPATAEANANDGKQRAANTVKNRSPVIRDADGKVLPPLAAKLIGYEMAPEIPFKRAADFDPNWKGFIDGSGGGGMSEPPKLVPVTQPVRSKTIFISKTCAIATAHYA